MNQPPFRSEIKPELVKPEDDLPAAENINPDSFFLSRHVSRHATPFAHPLTLRPQA